MKNVMIAVVLSIALLWGCSDNISVYDVPDYSSGDQSDSAVPASDLDDSSETPAPPTVTPSPTVTPYVTPSPTPSQDCDDDGGDYNQYRCGQKNSVLVCHRYNQHRWSEVCIKRRAACKHLQHGDHLGECR